MWKTIISVAVLLLAPFIARSNDGVAITGEEGNAYHELMKTLAEQGFSGTILVAKKGEVILSNGYGLANKEEGIPNSPLMVYTFGSITKQFTAAAILKLEMQGQLKVTDKISKFLGKLPRDKRKITIHHLLTHTAGLRPQYGDDFATISRDEIIEKIMRVKVRSGPGERHVYSNAGYSLLGAIIEIVSEQTYEQYLHENLFLPAGMKDTGYLLPAWDEPRLAQGYGVDDKWGTLLDRNWDTDGPYWHLRANGGIMSTVLDMYKWHRALLNDSILGDEARRKMFTRHIAEDDSGNWHYGYGWAIGTTERNTKLITHNGGNGIFFADFRRYIDEDIVFIYACNYVYALTGEMERLIRKQAVNPPAIP